MNSEKLLLSMELMDDEYILEAAPENAKPMRSFRRSAVLRWLAAAAAVIAVILTGAVIIPLLGNGPVPVYENAAYSASEVAQLFSAANDGATSSYQKIYVPSGDYLELAPAEHTEYLTVYTVNQPKIALDEAGFSAFTSPIFSALARETGEALPEYEIKRRDYAGYRELQLHIDFRLGPYNVSASQYGTRETSYESVYISSSGRSGDLFLGGVKIEVDRTGSDQEILASLEKIRQKLFAVFGCDFTDVKLHRYFDGYGAPEAQALRVYFYNESDHPLNAFSDRPVSDYIGLYFDMNYVAVAYRKNRTEVENIFPEKSRVRMISLEEAETFLYNGYVFGGHSCPQCMAAQDKVDFHGYDHVGLTYIFPVYGLYDLFNLGAFKDVIPFYAFYKKIGKAENGNTVYARTYVPAIELSGYEEYFKAQEAQHIDYTRYDDPPEDY